jgi:glycine betaine/proline transport system substrate-binding protein
MDNTIKVLRVCSISIVAAGCVGDNVESETNETTPDTVKLALPPWPGVTVKSHVVKVILEERGYDVQLNKLDVGLVYSQMAKGELDAYVGAWLPITHEPYWDKFGEELEMVSTNIPETWLGIAVPSYVYEAGIHSIEDLRNNADKFDGRIVGIEHGAGMNINTEEVIESYDLEGFKLEPSSTPAMLAEVDSAISNGEWIAHLAWEPHSMFVKFDIRKLEDPQCIYSPNADGTGDKVYIVTRDDFKEDYPILYKFFKNFEIDSQIQSQWIYEYGDMGKDPSIVASEWVEENGELIDQWWPS